MCLLPEWNALTQGVVVKLSGKTIGGILLGIVGTLTLGLVCAWLWYWEGLMISGIVIGIFGIVGMVAAYPLYAHITKKQREKLAPEIIRLTDELMK